MTKEEIARRYTYDLFKLTAELEHDDIFGFYLRNLRETLDHIYVSTSSSSAAKNLNFLNRNIAIKYSPNALLLATEYLVADKPLSNKLVLEHVLPQKLLISNIIQQFRENNFTYESFIDYIEVEFIDKNNKVFLTKEEDDLLNKKYKTSCPDVTNPYSRYVDLNLEKSDFKNISIELFLLSKYNKNKNFNIINTSAVTNLVYDKLPQNKIEYPNYAIQLKIKDFEEFINQDDKTYSKYAHINLVKKQEVTNSEHVIDLEKCFLNEDIKLLNKSDIVSTLKTAIETKCQEIVREHFQLS